MNIVRARIDYIRENLPQEATCPNILKHFLKIIRELYESGSKVNIICDIFKTFFTPSICRKKVLISHYIN